MNANRYRLVLDKRTGTLIPVADFVTRAKKGRGGARGADDESSSPSAWGRLRLGLMIAMGLWIPLTGVAQIVVDPSMPSAPGLSDTANGAPLINIADPNASGLSHNRFLEFNVDTRGAVFNNSMNDGVTQIGGHAMKNPNLTHSATGILAEVTGTNVSALQGAMEVFGPSADLLIANPNGLYVNGLSTINASNLLLTTGRPVGDGRQFEVLGGQVNLAGPVNTADLTHFDVVARSIALHGVVSGAADAALVAGLNHYDASTGAVTKVADGAGDAPELAIDGSSVGALHGSHVKLISTEAGLGVRHEGLVVSNSDLEITADGDVAVRRFQSAAHASIDGRNVSLGGADGDGEHSGIVQNELKVTAAGNVALQGRYSVEAADVSGANVSANDVRMTAQRRTGERAATVSLHGERVAIHGGNWEAHDRLAVSAGEAVIGANTSVAAQDVALQVRGDLRVGDDNGGQTMLQAGANLEVSAGRLLNDGILSAVDGRYALGELHNGVNGALQSVALNLALGEGTSTNAGVVYAHALDLRGLGRLDNEGTGVLLSEGSADIALGALYNKGVIDAGGAIQVSLGGLFDNTGTVSTRAQLGLSAGELVNRDRGTLYSVGDAKLQVSGNVKNLGQGMIVSEGDLVLNAAGDLSQEGQAALDEHGQPLNDRASIGARGDVVVSVGGDLDQSYAELYGTQVKVSTGGHLANDGSRIDGDDGLSLTVGGDLVNRADSYVVAHGGDLDVAVGGGLTNAQATLATAQDMRVRVGGIAQNIAGQIIAQRDAAWDAHTIENVQGGTFRAGRNLAVSTDADLTNTGGSVISAGWLLEGRVGANLQNSGGGSLIRGEYVDLEVAGAVDNRDKALIHATRALSLEAQRLANADARLLAGQVFDDGSQVQGDMELRVRGDIDNSEGGQITALGDLSIDADGNVRNDGSASIAASSAWISADADVDNAGRIQASDMLGVVARNVSNAGSITANELALQAKEQIDNAGEMIAGSWMTGDARQLDNRGQMRARDALELSTDTYANTGTIHTAGDAMLTIKDGLDLYINDAARGLTGDRSLTLNADDVRFDRELQNLGDIYINASTVDNARGVIGGGSIVATVSGAFTNHDLIWAAKDVDIQARELRNRAGAEIEAHRNVVLNVENTLTNEGGARIAALGDVKIDARALRNEMTTTGGRAVVTSREKGSSSAKRAHSGRTDTYEFIVGNTDDCKVNCGLPIIGSDLRVTAQGQIQAGRDVRINQGQMKDKGASVYNQGQIQAGSVMALNGNIDNVGASSFESIESYLKRPAYFEINATALEQHRSKTFTNFYDLLDYVFSKKWSAGMGVAGFNWHSDWVANAMKEYDNPQFSMVMAHIFGADWRAKDYQDSDNPTNGLVGRWNAFKADIANRGGFQLVADRAAELAAGGSIVHGGGYLRNGTGGESAQNRPLTVSIGDESVQTIGGNFDVLINLGDLAQALDPSLVWQDMTGGRKFRPAPGAKQYPPVDWSLSPPVTGVLDFDAPPVSVVPLYETRIEYIDQSQFFGTDYFFRKVGYVTDRTVTVIGDNYFVNELVTKQISGQVGTFMSVRDRVSGADQVKLLMDAAGEEGARLGLQVGIAPTAAQLAALDRDIVWFVASEVDGQTVLVPTVYLSAQTLAQVRDERASGVANVAAADHVVIDADEGGVRNNNGAIRAGKSLDITSKGTVTNSADNGLNGGLRAGDALIIDAQGDVTNIGSSIEGHDVVIRTEGNFSDSVRMGYNERGDLVVGNKSRIRGGGADSEAPSAPAAGKSSPSRGSMDLGGADEIAKANASGGGGSVSIQAKGDVTLIGSDIRAKDVLLASEGNLTSTDVHEVSSTFDHKTSNGFLSTTSVTETSANAKSVGSTVRGAADGGSLVLKAGKDVTLQGGEYGADVGLIQADGNVVTKTGRDYSHQKTVTVAEGFSVGARAGAGGAGAAAEYGPMGGSTGVVTNGQENPPAAGGRPVSGGRPLSSGKAVLGETAGFQLGYERIEVTETHDTIKNKNAKLDFGDRIAIVAGGTVDIGGADISAIKDGLKGDVLIQGADVISTKYEDVDRRATERKEYFAGLSGSGQSSVVDAVTKSKMLADKAKQDGVTVDPGMTVAQAAGDVSNLVFNDLAGGSVNVGFKHSQERSSTTERKENINTVTGNIAIVSTKGDIKLAGVKLDGNGASVTLDSAGKIELESAKTTLESESSRQNHQASIGLSGSVAPTGTGVGLSLGYNGGRNTSKAEGASHTNSQIVGSDVVIKSAGDTTLKGAEVLADRANVQVGGKLRVESVQDTYQETGTRATWGASAGVALTSQSSVGVTATGSVDAGYGESWDKSAKTASQSGIKANELNMDVAGDLEMKGAHVIAENGGKMNVGGSISAEKLDDYHDKDGWFGGGGGGISKSGLASVNIQLERDDRINYKSEQLNTIAGLDMNVAKGVNGQINSDGTRTENVIRNEKVAGNSMSLTLGVADVKQGIQGLRAKRNTSGGADLPQLPSRVIPSDSADSVSTPSRRPSTPGEFTDIAGPSTERGESVVAVDNGRTTIQISRPKAPVALDDVDITIDQPSRALEIGERLSYIKKVPGDTPTVNIDGVLLIVDSNGSPTRRVVERLEDGSLREVGMAKIPSAIDSSGRPLTIVDGMPAAPAHWPTEAQRNSTLRESAGQGTTNAEPAYARVDRNRPRATVGSNISLGNPGSRNDGASSSTSANSASSHASPDVGSEPIYAQVDRNRPRANGGSSVNAGQDATSGNHGTDSSHGSTRYPNRDNRRGDDGGYETIPADLTSPSLGNEDALSTTGSPAGAAREAWAPRTDAEATSGDADYAIIPADVVAGVGPVSKVENVRSARRTEAELDQRLTELDGAQTRFLEERMQEEGVNGVTREMLNHPEYLRMVDDQEETERQLGQVRQQVRTLERQIEATPAPRAQRGQPKRVRFAGDVPKDG